jgi:hypothetical protein
VVCKPSKLLPFKKDWTPEMFIDEMRTANLILFDYVINYCLTPGKIENWIFLIDVEGMGITDVDRKVMKQIM